MSLWCLQDGGSLHGVHRTRQKLVIPGAATWGPDGLTYNGKLVTCPRHYKQGNSNLSHFYYDPGADLLRAIIVYSTTYWPSWDVQRLDFSAETGEWVNRGEVLAGKVFVGIWGSAWTGKVDHGKLQQALCLHEHGDPNQ